MAEVEPVGGKSDTQVAERMPHLLGEGADLAVRMGGRPWPGFTCIPLMDDELYPVVSPVYWAAHGRPSTSHDLRRLRLLHDRDPNASWALWKKHHGPSALDTRIGPRLTSSDLVLAGAEQGLGVALARHRLAGDAIESGALLRPFGDARVTLPQAYWIILSDAGAVRDAVRVVVDWLESETSIVMEIPK